MGEALHDHRLCIFDADDTLRRCTVPGQPSPRNSGEWVLLRGVAQTLGSIPWNTAGGPFLGLASNQDQVGYGHMTEETARALLRDLAKAAAGVDLPDAALQLCPHRLESPCECRKPRPAMLLRIMAFYGVAPQETLFVGNSEHDRLAGEAAGTRYADAADLFSSSAEPSARRSPRTPPPGGADSYGAAEVRTTRE
jgi:D-glycero-D-manno-heptose 1,7-bisphosphate phosphatase